MKFFVVLCAVFYSTILHFSSGRVGGGGGLKNGSDFTFYF